MDRILLRNRDPLPLSPRVLSVYEGSSSVMTTLPEQLTFRIRVRRTIRTQALPPGFCILCCATTPCQGTLPRATRLMQESSCTSTHPGDSHSDHHTLHWPAPTRHRTAFTCPVTQDGVLRHLRSTCMHASCTSYGSASSNVKEPARSHHALPRPSCKL